METFDALREAREALRQAQALRSPSCPGVARLHALSAYASACLALAALESAPAATPAATPGEEALNLAPARDTDFVAELVEDLVDYVHELQTAGVLLPLEGAPSSARQTMAHALTERLLDHLEDTSEAHLEQVEGFITSVLAQNKHSSTHDLVMAVVWGLVQAGFLVA